MRRLVLTGQYVVDHHSVSGILRHRVRWIVLQSSTTICASYSGQRRFRASFDIPHPADVASMSLNRSKNIVLLTFFSSFFFGSNLFKRLQVTLNIFWAHLPNWKWMDGIKPEVKSLLNHPIPKIIFPGPEAAGNSVQKADFLKDIKCVSNLVWQPQNQISDFFSGRGINGSPWILWSVFCLFVFLFPPHYFIILCVN